MFILFKLMIYMHPQWFHNSYYFKRTSRLNFLYVILHIGFILSQFSIIGIIFLYE